MKMVTQSSKPNNLSKADGIPSKELFITMLVKDITLKDAIGDLIDNSVDAANGKSNNKTDLNGFSINIHLDKSRFEIIDNCGGIEEKTARESAFKLGKPKNYNYGKHTIGLFGIGMKRAFFKLGDKIVVESKALNSSFQITIPVNEWKDRTDEKDWDFSFDSVNPDEKHDLKDTITKIVITDLKEDVKKQFSDPQFLIDLKNEISKEHLFAINKGLTISINNEKLKPRKIYLIYDDDFKPSYWKHDFPNGLTAEIIVGASEDINEDGGWYIFCNERLIIGPDTSNITGWTGGRGKGEKGEKKSKELPKYHDQYFRFRGFIFFNSDDSTKLPWTTSKTTIDPDSTAFLYIKTQMITMARQVLDLLDKMKKEREKGNPIENQKLNNKVKNATIRPVLEVIQNQKNLKPIYIYPGNDFNPMNVNRNKVDIKFSKPKKEVDQAMVYFDVNDANDAGSLAFDYFYENAIK
jgi:hypothetical protein